eukprot:6086210-Amphidinium_carterae.2
MTASRVASNRTTQRLEQVEASAREVQVLVSREHDELYEQLMQALGSHSNQVAIPPPPATAIQPPPAPLIGVAIPTPQAYGAPPAPSHSHVQQTAPLASNPHLQQGGANPLSCGTGGQIGSSSNPLTGMGYGMDPPIPLQTPGPLSQGTLAQHFSIATQPHPQQAMGALLT